MHRMVGPLWLCQQCDKHFCNICTCACEHEVKLPEATK